MYKQNDIIMKNTITISLDESKIDNLYNEVKISKKLLLINNLTNRMIDTKKLINQLRNEIKENRIEINTLKDKLLWEKDFRVYNGGTYKDKCVAETSLENEIYDIKYQNENNRDMISEMKAHFIQLKNRLKTMGV